MYHYVRPGSPELPYLRYLHGDDFRRQLDHFQAGDRIIGRTEFLEILASGVPSADGVVLTFDDGFRDHYDHVRPELVRRGLWGIFYVPTGMYATGRLIDVHRVHYLLGRYGGPEMMAALERIVTPEMLNAADEGRFGHKAYARQDNEAAFTRFKQIINYTLRPEYKAEVLGRLMDEHFDEAALVRDFYCTPAMLAEMQDQGMIIGSHSVTHPVLSRLSVADQRREIFESFAFLDEATGGLPLRTFCHPYGGGHSFTPETEELLDEAGCAFSFNVEPRDITAADLEGHPQALPRYDCNMFPHGQARKADPPEDATGDVVKGRGPGQ